MAEKLGTSEIVRLLTTTAPVRNVYRRPSSRAGQPYPSRSISAVVGSSPSAHLATSVATAGASHTQIDTRNRLGSRTTCRPATRHDHGTPVVTEGLFHRSRSTIVPRRSDRPRGRRSSMATTSGRAGTSAPLLGSCHYGRHVA